MHITQPTLSRQMAAFEEDLGITLFIRNGKKISLTDEGILLKRRALEILIAFTSNLGTNAGVMAANGLGYPISIEGAAKYWREDILVQRRISPEITTSTVIAWRRNIPYSLAVRKMIEEINAFQA